MGGDVPAAVAAQATHCTIVIQVLLGRFKLVPFGSVWLGDGCRFLPGAAATQTEKLRRPCVFNLDSLNSSGSGLPSSPGVARAVPKGPYFQAYPVPTVEPLQARLAGA